MAKGLEGVRGLQKGSKTRIDSEEVLVYGNLGVNITRDVDHFVKYHLGYSILTRILLKCLELKNEFFRIEILLKKVNNKICVLFFDESGRQIGASSFHKPGFIHNGLKLLFVNGTMHALEEVPKPE